MDPEGAMNGEEELILGTCTLPLEDDSCMKIVITQYPSYGESELITGDIGDFPVFCDDQQDENGRRLAGPSLNQVKMEDDDSYTTLTASETNSTCELAFPNISCLPSTGQLKNTSPLNTNEITKNESSVATDNKKGSGKDSQCSQKFMSENESSTNPEVSPFSCPNCSRKFIRKYNRDFHMDACDSAFPDIICLPSTGQLKNSSTLNTNEVTKNKSCVVADNKKGKHGSGENSQCSQKFNSEKHWISNPEVSPFSCTICSKKFVRKCNRDYHMKHKRCKPKDLKPPISERNLEIKHNCPLCLMYFGSSCLLRDHIITGHNKSVTYICPICQKSINVLENLVERHLLDHVSKLECTTCELKYESREKLDAHVEAESSAKGHLKCLDCQLTFCKRIDLFTHIINHLPAGDCTKSVACDVCKLRLRFTKDFLNRLTGVGFKTSTHASDSDIEWIDTEKEEYEIVHISDDDDDDHITESHSDKTPVQSSSLQSSGAQSPVLQSPVGPMFTLQSSGGQSSHDSHVQSSMPLGTVLFIPQMFLFPAAMGMAPNLVSSAAPNLVSSDTIAAQSAVTAATSTTASQPTSEQRDSMECMKSDLVDGAFPDNQKENLQDEGEDGSTLQLRLQNVYSLAGSVPPLEFMEDGVVSVNKSDSSETEAGCLRNCPFCWQRLEDLESLKRHERTHVIRKRRYACPRCYRLYNHKRSMLKHFDAKRCSCIPPSTFTCKQCGALFSHQSHLVEHLMTGHTHSLDVGPTCQICKVILSEGRDLDNHLEVVHKLRLESVGGGMTVLRDIPLKNGTLPS